MGRFKVSAGDITYGPKEEVDKFVGKTIAYELMLQGYRRVSSAYCKVARIDREDWLDRMAKQLGCAKADFYNMDGSGISDRWRDHYVRCFSQDKLTLHPSVSIHMKAY